MPREIRTTLAVDGEQAFKRAINEANTSMKNLGTQLTLASAQFKQQVQASCRFNPVQFADQHMVV